MKSLARYYKAKCDQVLKGFIYRQCLNLVRQKGCLRSVG